MEKPSNNIVVVLLDRSKWTWHHSSTRKGKSISKSLYLLFIYIFIKRVI
jgi:hypothetical protein